MHRNPEMLRLTSKALHEELRKAGLTLRTFSRTFNVGYDQCRRWTLPEGHERHADVPYWVTVMLHFCQQPGGLNKALELYAENRADEGDSDAA